VVKSVRGYAVVVAKNSTLTYELAIRFRAYNAFALVHSKGLSTVIRKQFRVCGNLYQPISIAEESFDNLKMSGK